MIASWLLCSFIVAAAPAEASPDDRRLLDERPPPVAVEEKAAERPVGDALLVGVLTAQAVVLGQGGALVAIYTLDGLFNAPNPLAVPLVLFAAAPVVSVMAAAAASVLSYDGQRSWWVPVASGSAAFVVTLIATLCAVPVASFVIVAFRQPPETAWISTVVATFIAGVGPAALAGASAGGALLLSDALTTPASISNGE